MCWAPAQRPSIGRFEVHIGKGGRLIGCQDVLVEPVDQIVKQPVPVDLGLEVREDRTEPDGGAVHQHKFGRRGHPTQPVKVAAALVNDPEVLILDEPLTGLDPVQRRHMIALFHRLGDDGRCVLVSSHVLDEVAKIGSRVLVIAQGRLVASGDYRDLRELMDDRAHRIRLAASDPRKLAKFSGFVSSEIARSGEVHWEASGWVL